MPRKRRSEVPALPLRRESVYTTNQLARTLDISRDTICQAKKDGLRYSLVGSACYFLGEWVIDWIATRETGRKQDGPAP
jgi:hypothetical protein